MAEPLAAAAPLFNAAQLAALAQPARTRFLAALDAALREHFPDAAAEPPGQLDAALLELMEQARACGLHTEAQLAQYAVAAWLLGRDFTARFTEAGRVLHAAHLTAAEKHAWLGRWLDLLFFALDEE